MSSYINLYSSFRAPVSNHQVSSHDRIRQAFSKRLQHVLGRFWTLSTDWLTRPRVNEQQEAHSYGFDVLISPLTPPPPALEAGQPKMDCPGGIVNPGQQHKLGRALVYDLNQLVESREIQVHLQLSAWYWRRAASVRTRGKSGRFRATSLETANALSENDRRLASTTGCEADYRLLVNAPSAYRVDSGLA